MKVVKMAKQNLINWDYGDILLILFVDYCVLDWIPASACFSSASIGNRLEVNADPFFSSFFFSLPLCLLLFFHSLLGALCFLAFCADFLKFCVLFIPNFLCAASCVVVFAVVCVCVAHSNKNGTHN